METRKPIVSSKCRIYPSVTELHWQLYVRTTMNNSIRFLVLIFSKLCSSWVLSIEYFTVQQQIFSPTATLPVRVLDILHIILNFSLMNSNQVCSDKVCVPRAYNKMDVPRSDTICNIWKHTATIYVIQGVPYHWIHFVFVIFSGSRAHTEELFIAIG